MKFFRLPFLIAILTFTGVRYILAQETNRDCIIRNEFIFDSAPFAECHASTIAETADGLAVAYFGGTAEKNPDVAIWISLYRNGKWDVPVEIANGISPDGKRYPCWNPVLYRDGSGVLLLFYKVGPDPVNWWGMIMKSADGGRTWSVPARLPDGILGPVKNKPVRLQNGELLCPTSTEAGEWQVYFERTADLGLTWSKSGFVDDPRHMQAIQPAILFHGRKRLQALCRSRGNVIAESWSKDNGKTWTPLAPTSLPNPNSGIDAVTLTDGRQLLVYNPSNVPEGKWTGPRSPICIAISKNGKVWHKVLTLDSEPGELSYPAVIQTSDGMVHITYTWKRTTIRHITVDPDNI